MRTAGFLVAALALASTLAFAGAQAQGDCQVELLEADGLPATGNFSQGETRTFTYVAQNSGDLDAEAEVFIQDPAPGWSWPTNRPTLSIAAGGSEEINVGVTHVGDGVADASFEIMLEDVRCSGGLVGDGIQGDTNGPQTATFSAAEVPAGAGDGLPWAWIVFGLLVAGAVVGVPLAYRARQPRVEASVEESEKDVVAGRGTSFPVTLKNKSKDPVPVKLEVVDVQEGWSALTTLPDLELSARETRTVYMMVRAPPDAKPGDLCVAKLEVTPEGGSSTTVKTLARVDETAGEGEEGEAGDAGQPEGAGESEA